MKNYRLLTSLILTATIVSFSGCGALSGTSSGSSQKDASAASGSSGMTMELDSDGQLDIERTNTGSTPMGEDGTWTILIYMCGTDLESQDGCGTLDLDEMQEASLGGNVKFIVETGGCKSWQNDIVSSSELGRYEVTSDGLSLIESVAGADMGDETTLSGFLTWGVENYPAARMGVVLWNHGGGSITGVCFDENYDEDSLSLAEIDSALGTASDVMTDKFEFIGFDACLMSSIETANICANYARYMYASEETESGYGWDYTSIGNYLVENTEADGASLGKIVADSYYDSCVAEGSEASATFSVVELSKIDDVLTAFETFSASLYNNTEETSVLAEVMRAIRSVENFGGNNMSEGYTNMIDLSAFAKAVSSYADGAEELISAISDAVVYMINGSSHENAGGLSVYYPLLLQGSDELATFGEVAVSPSYLSFVDRAAYGSSNGETSGYDNSAVTDLWSEFWSEGGAASPETSQNEWEDYWDSNSYSDMTECSESQYLSFLYGPAINSDGYYSFQLKPSSLEYTESVLANIYMEYMGDLVELGTTTDVVSDWDNGEFTDNFDGYWVVLPDGQELALYYVSESDGVRIFTSPIMLNGERTNLRLSWDYETNTVTLDGTWAGVSESGSASRDVTTLSSGDTIVPLYYSANSIYDPAYEGEEYTYDGNPSLTPELLDDGNYYYRFYIYDVYGDYLTTDFARFTLEGGTIYYYITEDADGYYYDLEDGFAADGFGSGYQDFFDGILGAMGF